MLAIFTLLIAAIVSIMATPIVIALAHKIDAVDHPGPRKIHAAPIPRIGGLAVFAGFGAGLVFAAHATGVLYATPTVTVYWLALACAAFVMFAFGLLDDIKGLSFKAKFAFQVAASVVVWFGGFRIEILNLPFSTQTVELGMWSLPLTVFWIVGITNAVNLIDGLDGLAAGTALIVTSAVAVIAVFRDQTGVLTASTALVGALAGFLIYNFNPARIFLGDSGSLFLGFVLAVISIRSSQKGTTAVAVLTPLLILGLPILDTGLAIFRRTARLGRAGWNASDGRVSYVLRNAHTVFLPDRGHVHHRLLDLGLHQRHAVLALYALVVMLAAAALVHVLANSVLLAMILLAVLAAVSMLFVWMVILTRRRRERRRAHVAKSGGVDGATAPVIRDLAEVGRAPRR